MSAEDYAVELNKQLTYLFEWARLVGELDMAGSLFGEFRGAQDAGWSTAITAYEVRNELVEFDKRGTQLSVPELRQVLCLYSQLAEAGGVYEGLLNLMGVIQLKPYNLWPFQNLVRVKQSPKRIIGPNANAMFRHLATVASDIGMKRLSELLEVTFRDDIRNGIFHADYIIAADGLRLRRRNGGAAVVVTYEEINVALTNALNFFNLFEAFQQTGRESFRPAREIIGRFSSNPPMPYTVELRSDGSFVISTSGIGRQTDAAYDRQEHINGLLSGRVMATYVVVDDADDQAVLDGIRAVGFEPMVVEIDDQTKLAEVVNFIDMHGLWSDEFDSQQRHGLLIIMPSGAARVANVNDFASRLPNVESLEVSTS